MGDAFAEWIDGLHLRADVHAWAHEVFYPYVEGHNIAVRYDMAPLFQLLTNRRGSVATVTGSRAFKWFRQEMLRIHGPEPEGASLTVFECHQGFRVVQLLTIAAYHRDGRLMDNCLRSFGRVLKSPVYSLRDPRNIPRATIQYFDGFLAVRGRYNRALSPRYRPYAAEFLASGIVSIPSEFSYDLPEPSPSGSGEPGTAIIA